MINNEVITYHFQNGTWHNWRKGSTCDSSHPSFFHTPPAQVFHHWLDLSSTQYFCQPYLIYLIPQAPRNSSITKKGSGRSLVGFRVRLPLWQSLQMTKMPSKSFKKYSFCIHMAYNVYIY
jgi:hypothetical protein